MIIGVGWFPSNPEVQSEQSCGGPCYLAMETIALLLLAVNLLLAVILFDAELQDEPRRRLERVEARRRALRNEDSDRMQ